MSLSDTIYLEKFGNITIEISEDGLFQTISDINTNCEFLITIRSLDSNLISHLLYHHCTVGYDLWTYERRLFLIKDEDSLFYLKGLLVEHSGSNLRNRMAHGLINDDGFLSPLMSYLWWLTLRLCCLPMIIHQQKVEQSNPWVKFAGMFKDDPLFDEFVEEMAAYRRELDAEINSDEETSEEK
jgi:hypothetical protein